jgi:hypothetical protein
MLAGMGGEGLTMQASISEGAFLAAAVATTLAVKGAPAWLLAAVLAAAAAATVYCGAGDCCMRTRTVSRGCVVAMLKAPATAPAVIHQAACVRMEGGA